MIDEKTCFSEEKAKKPYSDSEENLKDYMTLARGIAELALRWRDECDEEGFITPRGVRISGDNAKSIEVIRNISDADRDYPVMVPYIQAFVKEGLDYIGAREKATEKKYKSSEKVNYKDILRIKNIREVFALTKRQTILMLLLAAARGDVHILETYSYIAADNSILEEGAPTVGLIDMLLHLIFEYEVIQAEVITDRGSTFARYFIRQESGDKSLLQKKISICDNVYKYMVLGEASFDITPKISTPGTGIYYEEFAGKLNEYEASCEEDDTCGYFCYIKAGDTEDSIHILTKVFEEQKKPLYVIEADNIKADKLKPFFTLRLLHYIYDAKVLVRFRSKEEENRKVNDEAAENIASVISILKGELGDLKTIYMTGTISLPMIEVYGRSTPAVLKLEKPDVSMRLAMWQELFREYAITPGEGIDLLDIADCHELYFGQIRSVVERCASTIRMTSPDSSVVERKLFQDILFSVSKVDFEYLATQVEAKYTWDDIFLEESQKVNLKYACDRFRLRNRIGAQWEITKKNAYGNAVIVLMYGPPGTGKTMAAQVVANEVMTPLYRVDVSQIFSKYIGETQKNISRIFEEAQKRNVVLFFDEADA
ncbi:MAG: ATP-binding protein, partial [Lachnospiraceae bacterium]|nr:ATP-binding protein [Lachnospiraceae bacterium]